jgi:hypothetical protein
MNMEIRNHLGNEGLSHLLAYSLSSRKEGDFPKEDQDSPFSSYEDFRVATAFIIV